MNAPQPMSPLTSGPPPASASKPRPGWARRLTPLLETHISLPPFALLLIVALWVVTFHMIRTERAAAEQGAREGARKLAETYEAQMARSLSGIDQTLKMLKYAVERDGPAPALATLRQRGLLPPAMLFVAAVADRHGVLVARSPSPPPGPPVDISHEPHFTMHRAADTGMPYASRASGDSMRHEPHLHFTRRLNDAKGGFAGIAIIVTDPAYFTSAYERSREGDHGMLGLVGDDGVVRAMRIGDQVSWGQHLPMALLKDGQVRLDTVAGDGTPRYLCARRLHGFGMYAIVGLDAKEAMAAFARRERTWLAAAATGTALLAILVALLSAWSWQAARARRSVRHAQETYAAASEASVDAFFVFRSVFGADGSIVDLEIEMANGRAEKMTGRSLDQLRGTRICELMPHYRRNGVFAAMARVARDGGVEQAEWLAEVGTMAGRWLHLRVVQVEGGAFAMISDINERKLAADRIVHMAHHDDLTGLPNRTMLRLRLTEAIVEAERKQECVALVFVDLDGFKLINDGLGHSAGDELLKVIGQRMQACLRRGDTLARFGGDEFVLLLPATRPDPQALAPLLDKLRHAVQEPAQVAGQSVQVSCSAGVVMYPRDGRDADTLLMNADAAMYRAKDGGRNNYRFYTRDMNARGEENLVLLDGLRQSLDASMADDGGAHGFTLLYQPKIELASGRMFGVEALLRWEHPEHGQIAPARFIGLAEDSGMIVDIGDWALRTACRQAMAWRAAGLPPITVSVNVSPRQFEERRLVERVAAALADSGLPPDGLELEVTETLIMRDLAQSIAKMRTLQQMGVSLSIDDFGTGYSSLSSLKSFPISRLKIDQTFVRELADNPGDQAIATAVISLGHKLKLRVIAEGVETEAQCAFLRAHGCDEMQGYLFSKPVPPERIAALLLEEPCQPEAA
ncbi:hypothetical protein GCM10027321_45780 [Massilia terrae]|uniref:EAL domain-containing protein n=1 Tax=Massilia terrae TaxID=1811224 RepID=A0ABT2D4D3_9BURK|nr:EAL domain-containing protein [Massilia terrae]MCS0660188.1 EAL domain-containing protein [Massilia terrae]